MPTVSAIIATYNRAPVLRRMLESLLAQSRVPDEIVVIDDASSDDTRAMMHRDFPPRRYPQVRYVRTPQNMGQAYNRNLGVVSTSGDYILSMDDDAWFEAPDGLARAVDYMEAHPDAGAAAFNVRLANGWLYLPEGMPVDDVGSYIGCGVIMRRDVAERTLYVPELAWSEESDRSIRVYDLGYRVVGLPHLVVFHAMSEKNRDWARFRFMSHRGGLMRELARCPMPLLPLRFLSLWAGQTLTNFREGHWATDFKVLWHLPLILRIGLRHRKPVSVATYRKWRAILMREREILPEGQGPRQIGESAW